MYKLTLINGVQIDITEENKTSIIKRVKEFKVKPFGYLSTGDVLISVDEMASIHKVVEL